jgi:protein-L-isoaspartate(D-aspartate) O-methyltransferase
MSGTFKNTTLMIVFNEQAIMKDTLITTLRQKGIKDKAVLAAIAKVPRDFFVPPEYEELAYLDIPLPIAANQTISQPYIVARMIEAIKLPNAPINTVLEIGVGSGYKAAVLSHLAKHVYGIERIKHLFDQAKIRLKALNLNNIELKFADGRLGWSEKAPFDAIIVSATAPEIPKDLLAQLKDGGKMIIPLQRESHEELCLITKNGNRFKKTALELVRFVPLMAGTSE